MSKKSKKKQPQPKQQAVLKLSRSSPRWMFALIIIAVMAIAGFFLFRFYQDSQDRKLLSSLSQMNLTGIEPQVVTKIQNLQEAVRKNPGSAAAWGKLAINLDVHDFENEAIPIYKKAAILDSSDFRWPYFISILLAKIGDQESLDWFERAHKIKPDYVPMLVNYGNTLFQFNKNDQAAEKYKQALTYDPKCAQALFGLARIEFAKGNMENSFQNLKQALQFNSSYGEASNLLLTVCKRLKRADCNVSAANSTSQKTELNDPVYAELTAEGESSLWYRFRGSEYFKKGIYDKAIVEFERALKLRQDAQLHEDLAQALSASGRFQEAAEHYREALKTHSIAENYFHLALVFAKMGQYDDAEENLKKAIQQKPDFAEAYFNLAVLYAKSHRLQDAVDNLKQAIHYKPDYVEAHFYLGQAYIAAGDNNGANQEYQILSKLDSATAQRLHSLMQQK
ncbi:tetratricopeptide repeat protein [bacterium]|nr:tetratricopeptide repeat protein [bacterium]